MTSLPIYPVGTKIRIYHGIPYTSEHHTAIVLPNETVLEIKNPHTNTRTTFPTMADWKSARETSASTTVYDYTDAKGELIEDLRGFAVPSVDENVVNRWLRWCFSLMNEAAPFLCEREYVIGAYNKLATVLMKYRDVLESTGCLHVIDRYTLTELTYGDRAECGGLRMNLTLTDKAEATAASAEISKAYKGLHKRIYTDIERFCNYKQAEAKYNRLQKMIRSQIIRLEMQASRCKNKLNAVQSQIAELRAESLTVAQAADAIRREYLIDDR